MLRGDISLARADAIATSANADLCGDASPHYWRFSGRKSADGAVRARAGPRLAALAAAALPGPSARLPPGVAVTTPAAGDLRCTHVIHAVAPDGMDGREDGARLLHQTYAAVLAEARRAGARALACPAIGCGIQGFPPDVAAREALAVAVGWLARGDAARLPGGVERLAFWIHSEDVWRSWPARAEKLLGPAPYVRKEMHRGAERTLEFIWTAAGSSGQDEAYLS